eukprot:1748891-Heterocapsa_arctica.AAC.1
MEMRERGLRRVGLGSTQTQGANACEVLDLTEAPQLVDQAIETGTQTAQQEEEVGGGSVTQEAIGPGPPPAAQLVAEAEKWRKHA